MARLDQFPEPMGAADPAAMESSAKRLAGPLKGDQVDAALLVPV